MDNLTSGNPVAHRVRVYYDGSSTIAEGMPVCYNYLITDNWFGGSVNDAGEITATTTTAEGSHNESKYIHVCNPAVAAGDSITPSASSKLITGGGDDFDALQVGMFVAITGTDVTNGNYKITAHDTVNDTITLDMTAATAATADVTVDMDNLHAFAGVVAKGGWCGKTGPRIVDIYIPNGAIVPVDTVLTATVVGRTILAINSGTITFGNPTTDIPNYGLTAGNIDARSVAIAEETVAAAGLLLARLDPTMFVYQGGQIGSELQVTGAVTTAVNRMNLDFVQTSGQCQALHYRAVMSGAEGNCQRGMYRFETILTGTSLDQAVVGLESTVDINCDDTAGGGRIYALHGLLRSRAVGNDLSGTIVAPLSLEYIMTGLGTDPLAGAMMYFNTDASGTVPDYFLYSMGVDAVQWKAQAAMTVSGGLKCFIAGVGVQYIMTSSVA